MQLFIYLCKLLSEKNLKIKEYKLIAIRINGKKLSSLVHDTRKM